MKHLFLILFFIAGALYSQTDHFSPYDKLDHWLDQYSLYASRAVIVEPGVALADADLLNGKIPPPFPGKHADQIVRNQLLECYGVELVLIRDDLAVCRWTNQPTHIRARDAAQRTLRSHLTDEKIPGRIITKNMTLKVER